MANLIQNKYFKSKDIRVFPSSFRGAYKSGLSSTDPEISFDPEARLNTEANFILPKPALGKTSYILEYNTTKDKITFVLGGYYFEILGVGTYLPELKNKYVGIKLRTITLHDVTNLDSQFQYDISRNTDILDSWHEASDLILDYKFDTTYCFTGLKVLSSGMSSEGSTASIKLFNADGTLNREDCLPEITHGSGIQTLRSGQGLIAAGEYQTVLGTFNENNTSNLFEVGNGESAISRRNALEIAKNKTTIYVPTEINGNVHVEGTLTVSEKVTSACTESDDAPETLITKSYVDGMIGGIGSGAVSGGAGEYVKAISQAGAAVTPTIQSFETSISESDPTTENAPTSKAVSDFVKSQVAKLDVAEIGGSKTYIQKISEADGKISAVPRSFSSEINATDDTTAPTVQAVYEYVDDIKKTIEKKITSEITSTVDGIKIETQVGGDGSYLKTINQSKGTITPVSEAFDTAVTANTKNAPTSAAVKTFTEATVNSKVAGIWTESSVKKSSSSAASSLKSIILDAIYPVGSVYICYSENKLEACPLKERFDGTEWEAIAAGKFLVSASTTNGIYKFGNTGGSADAVAVKHAHSFSNEITTNETGAHSHTIKWFDTSAHDSSTDNTLRSADSGDGGGVSESKWPKIETTSNGAHKHTFKLSGDTAESGYDGANKNLPPYIAVYMWRRTK